MAQSNGDELRERLIELDGELWDYQLDKLVEFILTDRKQHIEAAMKSDDFWEKYNDSLIKQHELDAIIKGVELVDARLADHFDPNGEALTEHYEGQNIVEAFIAELKAEREAL